MECANTGIFGQYIALSLMLLCTLQGYIRDRMQAGYDPEYLHQVFDFIVYSISCMEAPARRESTQKGYAEVLSGFTEAGAVGSERAGQRVRVSLDASSTPEVRTPSLPSACSIPGCDVQGRASLWMPMHCCRSRHVQQINLQRGVLCLISKVGYLQAGWAPCIR
jgi:hypothetical protein